MPTPTERLADQLIKVSGIDDGLAEYVMKRRADGVSWRRIAIQLYRDIDVDVTHETLRSWFLDKDTAA